jgi:hypothetical protein
VTCGNPIYRCSRCQMTRESGRWDEEDDFRLKIVPRYGEPKESVKFKTMSLVIYET